jgi:hypothetical protein
MNWITTLRIEADLYLYDHISNSLAVNGRKVMHLSPRGYWRSLSYTTHQLRKEGKPYKVEQHAIPGN